MCRWKVCGLFGGRACLAEHRQRYCRSPWVCDRYLWIGEVGFVTERAELGVGSPLMATSWSAVEAGSRRRNPGATFETLTED